MHKTKQAMNFMDFVKSYFGKTVTFHSDQSRQLVHMMEFAKILYLPKTSRDILSIVWREYRYQLADGVGKPKWFVSEPGMYQMIFASEHESASAIQRWVFEEVLPSIRKEGGYISPTVTPVQAIALSDKLAQIISPTRRPWTLHFSKEWQKEACRLTKVTWKHPRMGQFINQTVYDFFDKEAIAKIRELNSNGQQDHVAHHQYLTEKFDTVAYQQHLRDIEGYMMASPDLEFFWRLMSFRFKKTFQVSLFD